MRLTRGLPMLSQHTLTLGGRKKKPAHCRVWIDVPSASAQLASPVQRADGSAPVAFKGWSHAHGMGVGSEARDELFGILAAKEAGPAQVVFSVS